MVNPIVWTYWENPRGRTTPPHISLCREVLRRRSRKCRLEEVTPDNLRDYLPDLHPNIDRITWKERPDEHCLAIKAGIIRVLLLEKYGGLWIDSDAIVLKDLDTVFEKLVNHEFVGMRRTSSPKQHIVNNFFGSVPNGLIISEYAERIRNTLEQKTEYVWNEVGSNMLTPIVDKNISTAYLYPERTIHPLVAGQQPLYMNESVKVDDIIDHDTVTFMLFHRIFEGTHRKAGIGFRDYSIEDLYYSNALIGKIFRKAFPREQFEFFMNSTS